MDLPALTRVDARCHVRATSSCTMIQYGLRANELGFVRVPETITTPAPSPSRRQITILICPIILAEPLHVPDPPPSPNRGILDSSPVDMNEFTGILAIRKSALCSVSLTEDFEIARPGLCRRSEISNSCGHRWTSQLLPCHANLAASWYMAYRGL